MLEVKGGGRMDQVKIGSFLRELRKEKALTQEQLAEQFGVSGRTVSRWENGNNMPDISILIELADFYEVDIRQFLHDHGHHLLGNEFGKAHADKGKHKQGC